MRCSTSSPVTVWSCLSSISRRRLALCRSRSRRHGGALVSYLPGLAIRRIADLQPGEAKTDAMNAAIISETAGTMPHTLRSVQVADEQGAELSMLCGFDGVFAGQITQVSDCIRGALTQIHPALERMLGPRLECPRSWTCCSTTLRQSAMRAGERRLGDRLLKSAPRKGRLWAAKMIGTAAAALVLPRLAEQHECCSGSGMRSPLRSRRSSTRTLQPVLTSMPGVGDRTAARLLTEVTEVTGAPHRIRTPRARHEAIWDLDPRGASLSSREQGSESDLLSLRIRRTR